MPIHEVLTAARSPWQNPFAERLIGSIRRECLDHALVLSERHLRRIVTDYVTYFNQARPHQGIHQRIPCAPHLPDYPDGEIVGVPVLGGLHHDYQRQAAWLLINSSWCGSAISWSQHHQCTHLEPLRKVS
jgi:hypothetical protein